MHTAMQNKASQVHHLGMPRAHQPRPAPASLERQQPTPITIKATTAEPAISPSWPVARTRQNQLAQTSKACKHKEEATSNLTILA